VKLCDPEAERHVIGLVLSRPKHVADVAAVVRRDDFHIDRHREVWDAICSLEVPDLSSVVATLNRQGARVGEADETNGSSLGRLQREAPVWAMRQPPIARLGELRQARELVALGERLAHLETGLGSLGDVTLEEYAAEAHSDLLDITDRADVAGRTTLADLTETIKAERKANAAGREAGNVVDLRSGLPSLDRVVAFRPGRYIGVGGRPGEGKTTLLRQMLRSFTRTNNARAVLFTLEMTAEDQAACYHAGEIGMGVDQFMAGDRLTETQQIDLDRSIGDPSNRKLWILEPRSPTWPAIEREIEYLARHHGVRAFGLDYLQLLATPHRQSRQQGLGAASNGAKRLINRLGLTGIIAAQLNRAIVGAPTISNFRECGDIEQDCDAALLLNRICTTTGDTDILVAKNRRGATRKITARLEGHRSRFIEMDNRDD